MKQRRNMELEIYDDTRYMEDLAKEVLDRKIHLVTMAALEEPIAMQILERIFNVHQAAEFIDFVNKKRETGTFFPRVWLTLYPQAKKQDRVQDRLLQVARDIVAANEEQVMAERVLVLIHQKAGYNNADFIECLRHLLRQTEAGNKNRRWNYREV